MLELAYLNREELRKIFLEEILKEENKYYYFSNYFEYELPIEQSEWRKIQYVSKNKEGIILGYFGAYVNRQYYIIDQLEIINLKGKVDLAATKDFFAFLKLLFCKRKFRKIVVQVIKENPAFKMFNKFIVDYKIGAFIGILKDHCILTDGKCYDQYIFEMYKDNFEKSKYNK